MGSLKSWWGEYRAYRRLRRWERAISKGPLAGQYHDWKQQMIEKGLWK